MQAPGTSLSQADTELGTEDRLSMLLPNMAPHRVEYSNLKEFENWDTKEGLSDLLFSSLEEGL